MLWDVLDNDDSTGLQVKIFPCRLKSQQGLKQESSWQKSCGEGLRHRCSMTPAHGHREGGTSRKVDLPRAMLSAAPMRVWMASSTCRRADSAGTKDPTCQADTLSGVIAGCLPSSRGQQGLCTLMTDYSPA